MIAQGGHPGGWCRTGTEESLQGGSGRPRSHDGSRNSGGHGGAGDSGSHYGSGYEWALEERALEEQTLEEWALEERALDSKTSPNILLIVLWAHVWLPAGTISWLLGWFDQCRTAIHQGADKILSCHEETLGGHAPPSKPYYRGKMGRCGKEKQNATNRPQEDIWQEGKLKRKRCRICPAAKDRKVRSWRVQCSRPVCKEHKLCHLWGFKHRDGNLK